MPTTLGSFRPMNLDSCGMAITYHLKVKGKVDCPICLLGLPKDALYPGWEVSTSGAGTHCGLGVFFATLEGKGRTGLDSNPC
jgi:hypothetical protein